MKKKLNKFYVGAAHISDAIVDGENDDWTHPTLELAIKHAKDLIDSGEKENAVIVQIVAVVTRKKNPISVQKV